MVQMAALGRLFQARFCWRNSPIRGPFGVWLSGKPRIRGPRYALGGPRRWQDNFDRLPHLVHRVCLAASESGAGKTPNPPAPLFRRSEPARVFPLSTSSFEVLTTFMNDGPWRPPPSLRSSTINAACLSWAGGRPLMAIYAPPDGTEPCLLAMGSLITLGRKPPGLSRIERI